MEVPMVLMYVRNTNFLSNQARGGSQKNSNQRRASFGDGRGGDIFLFLHFGGRIAGAIIRDLGLAA
jgi:hypothetical protein